MKTKIAAWFVATFQVFAVVAKATGNTDFSWWIVLSPLIFVLVAWVIFYVIVALIFRKGLF